jgi:Zn-dependent protease with chaperone function
MPALYNYISYLSDKADIALPFIFISLKNLSASSRKLLGFRGSIVIGQQLINTLSDQQLESLIAQQIGHIKYIHTNKKAIIDGIGLSCNAYIIAALCSLLINKRFARQADMFAWQVAGRANGFITFYEELQAKDQLKRAEYDEVFKILTENRANISMLSYCILMLNYYVAEAKNYVEGKYSTYAYPSHQERIDAARRYVAQYENIH